MYIRRMVDRPSYTADRLARCMAKYIQHRATAIRHPELRMARALCMYWEKESRKAAGL